MSFSDDNVAPSIFSNIEVYAGIICASLPAVKPVIGKCFPSILLSNRGGSRGTKATFNDIAFGTNSCARPIRLHDVDLGGKTVTRVEADERGNPDLRGSKSDGDLGKDIFITTSMTQDVESKYESRTGSEKDLIIQRP